MPPRRERRRGPEPLNAKVVDYLNACKTGNLPVVRSIINSRNFEIDSCDFDDVTGLMHACANGHQEVVKELITKGAGMWCLGPKKDPRNAFQTAAFEGQLNVVRLFVEKIGIGAEGINFMGGASGRKTAVDYALERGLDHTEETSNHKYQVLAYLRQKGGVFGEGVTNPETVWEAAGRGDSHYVLYCLESCITHLDYQHGTEDFSLMHVAANGGYREMAKMLLTFGADVELKDRQGRSAAAVAASCGSDGVLEVLLGADANILARDAQGDIALHHACRNGNLPCAKMLLTTECSTSPRERILAKNSADRTPLMEAFAGGPHVGVVQYLTGILDTSISIKPIAGKDRKASTAVYESELAANKRNNVDAYSKKTDKAMLDVFKSPAQQDSKEGEEEEEEGEEEEEEEEEKVEEKEELEGEDAVFGEPPISPRRKQTHHRIIPADANAGYRRFHRFIDEMDPVLWGFKPEMSFFISRKDFMDSANGQLLSFASAQRMGLLTPEPEVPVGSNILFISHRWNSENCADDDFHSKYSRLFHFFSTQKVGGEMDYLWIDVTCHDTSTKGTPAYPQVMANVLPAMLRCTHFLALPRPKSVALGSVLSDDQLLVLQTILAGKKVNSDVRSQTKILKKEQEMKRAAAANAARGKKGEDMKQEEEESDYDEEEAAEEEARLALAQAGAATDAAMRADHAEMAALMAADAEARGEEVKVEGEGEGEETVLTLANPSAQSLQGMAVRPHLDLHGKHLRMSDVNEYLTRGWCQMEVSIAELVGLDMYTVVTFQGNAAYPQVLTAPAKGPSGEVTQEAGFHAAMLSVVPQVTPQVDEEVGFWEGGMRMVGWGTHMPDPKLIVQTVFEKHIKAAEEEVQPTQGLHGFIDATLSLHDHRMLIEFLGGTLDSVTLIDTLSTPSVTLLKSSMTCGELTKPDEDRLPLCNLHLVALTYLMGAHSIYPGHEKAARLAGKPKAQLQMELDEALERIDFLEGQLAVAGEAGESKGSEGGVRGFGGSKSPKGAHADGPPQVGSGGCCRGCVIS